MSTLFPRAKALKTGYDLEQVEAFFARARAAYDRPATEQAAMTALDVRHAAFDLKRGGYKTVDVDQALDRLETAFATRQRDFYVRSQGQDAWMQNLAQRAQQLYPRLRRPARKRFDAPRGLGRGYNAKQVDALLDRITAYFDTGAPVTPDDLRTTLFRRARFGAYQERQVDAYLAKSIDILLGAS